MKLTVKTPCPLTMTTLPATDTDKTWACSRCSKRVHNLSEMSKRDANEVLERRRSGERVCGQWVTDRRGRVLFNVARATAAALLLTSTARADGGLSVRSDLVNQPLSAATESNRLRHTGDLTSGAVVAGGPGLLPESPGVPDDPKPDEMWQGDFDL